MYFFNVNSKLILLSSVDLKQDISNTQKSLESCLNMLIPTPEDFFINNYDNVDVPNTSQVNISNSIMKNTEGLGIPLFYKFINTLIPFFKFDGG